MKLVVTWILSLLFVGSPAFAKSGRRVSNQKATIQTAWVKGKETVVNLKGQLTGEATNCETFQVQLNDQLQFKIDCAGHAKSDRIDLSNGSGVTVTQKGGHTTITKYNFMLKKPQVSRLQQSTLKVPYVEEIIHIKKSKDGKMSFYYESFRVDEFGRIVQDGFIQAHSLTEKKMKISAN